MQPQARAWLEEFNPEEAFAPNGLPVAVEYDRAQQSPDGGSVTVEKLRGAEVLFLCLSPSPMGGSILRLERREQRPTLRFKPLPVISERENETLRWMIEGKRNSEIVTILGISVRTVEKQVSAIIAALEVENRATAIVRAMERMAG